MEEEQNTMEYQETMKVYIGKYCQKTIWRPIYEVIHAPFFAEAKKPTRIFRQM